MNLKLLRIAPAALLAAVALASCSAGTSGPASRTVQPGAPGDSARVVNPATGSRGERPGHTDADVSFMQGMIVHHAQALRMASLVPARTDRPDVRLLAQRIEVSQADEIAMMSRWLEERGESVPPGGGHHLHGAAGGHADMPGMLTEAELARLEAARGTEFDRLFLALMIRHHQGALTMVEQLFTSRGAGQQGDVYQLAAEVADDQRIEIDRMFAMLAASR